MPHDKNGHELKPGDRVMLECEVKEVFANETACNASFKVLDTAQTGEYTPLVTCNARLATKLALLLVALLLSPAFGPAAEPVRFKDCPSCGSGCKCQLGKCPDGCPAADRAAAAAPTDAFAELSAYRARHRLPALARDEALSRAAVAAARWRAERHLFGHTANDFSFLPPGAKADAAGCAAYPRGYGIMACGLRDDHTHAGAAVVMGDDGKAYWHVFYRGGSGRELVPPGGSGAAPPAKASADVLGRITARCRAGEVFVQQVKAGDVPGVPAGVHRWRMVPDGRIRWDQVGGPRVVTIAESGPGELGTRPLVIPLRPVNPFALPGRADGSCRGTR